MADFEDGFTESSDVALENHTPDTTGTAWTQHRDGHDIAAADDFATNSAAGGITASDDIGTEDYDVQCDVKIVSTDTNRTGIGVRLSDISNTVHIRIKPSSDGFEMEKTIGGSNTTLAESTVDTIDVDTYYTLRVSAEGSGASQNFDGYFAGTLRLDPAAPNDAVLDTGEAFIGHNSTGVNGGTNHNWDNYTVTSKAVASLGTSQARVGRRTQFGRGMGSRR